MGGIRQTQTSVHDSFRTRKIPSGEVEGLPAPKNLPIPHRIGIQREASKMKGNLNLPTGQRNHAVETGRVSV